MAAAILSAPVLTAGGGQSQANGNGQTAAVQTESSVSYGESAVSGKPVNVSFDAPQQSGSGRQEIRWKIKQIRSSISPGRNSGRITALCFRKKQGYW